MRGHERGSLSEAKNHVHKKKKKKQTCISQNTMKIREERMEAKVKKKNREERSPVNSAVTFKERV